MEAFRFIVPMKPLASLFALVAFFLHQLLALLDAARALNRDMSVSQTSGHKEVILGRNSVFRVFRLYLRLSDPRGSDSRSEQCI